MERKPGPPVDSAEFRRRLDAMHANYRARAPAKVAEIESLWRRAKAADPSDPVRGALLLEAHTLVGSAPTLGCEALGAAAACLESALKASFEGAAPLPAAEVADIDRLVAGLGASLT
jgi:HPt (histidine-containing phosphotransfer) domain-containing protein